MIHRVGSRCLAGLLLACALFGSGYSAEATAVFTGGTIYTMDEKATRAGALAVRDGRIAAIGTDKEIFALAGPATLRVDLAGGFVTPTWPY